MSDKTEFYHHALISRLAYKDLTPDVQKEWEDFLSRFWNDAESFAALIEQMSDEKLKHIFVDESRDSS